MHPRLRSDLTAKPFYLMSPEELEKVERAQLEHEEQQMKSARDRWFEMLAAERDRRSYGEELLIDGQTPIEALLAKLDQMEERLRGTPDFVEPTPEEAAENSRYIDQWFKEFKKRSSKACLGK
jgi:hypothetical protein